MKIISKIFQAIIWMKKIFQISWDKFLVLIKRKMQNIRIR